MKIAVTGKGGVGKTTFTAILSRLYADEGRKVLAVDVDPDANLGQALGFSPEELKKIVPISQMKDMIKERTNSQDSAFSTLYTLNPKVDDLPEKYAKEVNGVKLLTLGTVDVGGSGCVCPEHTLIKRLIMHLVLRADEVVIMDMEAGIEHLGRGTASGVDAFIVVIEPGARSIQTYEKVKKLALDLGVNRVRVVANKVRDEEDEAFIRDNIKDDLLGFIHYNTDVIDADRKGSSPYDYSERAVEEIKQIKQKIDSDLEKSQK
ncbi:MAG: AAA family ATPase [Eubacteriaceae bacterium]|nr:AAA family ATPase [Eubacteriaceae bacterium]